jgi:hypothetical protein
MKKLYTILLLALLSIGAMGQNKYYTGYDCSFSGGQNGNWGSNPGGDYTITYNSVDGLMQVEVNKLSSYGVMRWFMENCWAPRWILNDDNRYLEFRVKSSVPMTGTITPTWGGPTDAQCAGPITDAKRIPNQKFTITESDTWQIFFMEFGASQDGTPAPDTLVRNFAFSMDNGSYVFDYIKFGDEAVPPQPTVDQIKTQLVRENADEQTIELTGIEIPNRHFTGLVIEVETEKDGILKDLSFVDLDGEGTYVDEDTKTATLNYSPVEGMAGQSDSIFIILKDTIRNTQTKMAFKVELLPSSLKNLNSVVDVYPTQVTNKVVVESNEILGADIIVIDMLGNVVKQVKVTESVTTIDMAKLPANTYVVKVITNDGIANKKVVKR